MIIRRLMDNYQWVLLSEAELLERVLAAWPGEGGRPHVEHLVKNQFAIALYEACHPKAEPELRSRGYQELARFLARVAYHRWPDLAADVVQRALLLVHEHFERCRLPVTFPAFALSYLRWAHQKESGYDERHQPMAADEAAHAARSVISAPDEPLALALAVEQAQAIREALASLAAQQRLAVELKYLRGWSDEAVAQHLEITPGNLRVIRYRTLRRLREHPALHTLLAEGSMNASAC